MLLCCNVIKVSIKDLCQRSFLFWLEIGGNLNDSLRGKRNKKCDLTLHKCVDSESRCGDRLVDFFFFFFLHSFWELLLCWSWQTSQMTSSLEKHTRMPTLIFSHSSSSRSADADIYIKLELSSFICVIFISRFTCNQIDEHTHTRTHTCTSLHMTNTLPELYAVPLPQQRNVWVTNRGGEDCFQTDDVCVCTDKWVCFRERERSTTVQNDTELYLSVYIRVCVYNKVCERDSDITQWLTLFAVSSASLCVCIPSITCYSTKHIHGAARAVWTDASLSVYVCVNAMRLFRKDNGVWLL